MKSSEKTIKTFDLGTVLSIITPVLLTDMGNVYKILDYMTGDNLYTHQLPRACKEMAPVILQQHPQLVIVNASGINTENWKPFLEEQIELFGTELEIIPCELWEHKFIDPQEELEQIVDPSKIIIVPFTKEEE